MGVLQNSMRAAMETHGYSEKTVALYITCVRVFANHFGRSPLLISTREIESFFHFLHQENRSDSTIHLYYVSLRFFYRLNNIPERMPRLRFAKIRNKIPMVLSQEKIAMMLDSCSSLKYKALFTLAYASGLRISELRDLCVSDIDFDRKLVYVRKGKNKRSRYTILGNRTAQLLKTYMNVYNPHSFLFHKQTDSSVRVNVNMIRRQLSMVLIKNGIDVREVHMHTFRHCFATHLMEGGTSIFHIMQLLGHANVYTTMVYLHMQDLNKLNITSPIDLLEPPQNVNLQPKSELFAATA